MNTEINCCIHHVKHAVGQVRPTTLHTYVHVQNVVKASAVNFHATQQSPTCFNMRVYSVWITEVPFSLAHRHLSGLLYQTRKTVWCRQGQWHISNVTVWAVILRRKHLIFTALSQRKDGILDAAAGNARDFACPSLRLTSTKIAEETCHMLQLTYLAD